MGEFFQRRAAVLAARTLFVADGQLAVPRVASAGSSPPGLSNSGRILWQFEALLHDKFGKRPVCASGRWAQNFTSGSCSPLAVYSPYFYVFANAHASAFHISSKAKVGGFGNYPTPVLVRGHPLACDRGETRFLILYRDTRFTLGCMRAGYVTP